MALGGDEGVNAAKLPKRMGWLFDGFSRYVHRYLRKHLHAVRVSKSGAAIPIDGEPILFVMNHPSWWDPMVGIALANSLAGYRHYAAIHSEMLKEYPIFGRLGFFGVDPQSLRSGAEFLGTGSTILSEPKRALWITAQGEFTDVRTRPLSLKTGVGHLAARMRRGWVVCVAFEYAFWTERTPEALIRVAEPIRIDLRAAVAGKEWTAKLEAILAANLDALNLETMSRDPAKFTVLLGGKTGVGGGYDLFRRLACWARFRRFRPGHGEVAP
jgi:1-acyl-sn-glycerol-3-phosphate acyltransferase